MVCIAAAAEGHQLMGEIDLRDRINLVGVGQTRKRVEKADHLLLLGDVRCLIQLGDDDCRGNKSILPLREFPPFPRPLPPGQHLGTAAALKVKTGDARFDVNGLVHTEDSMPAGRESRGSTVRPVRAHAMPDFGASGFLDPKIHLAGAMRRNADRGAIGIGGAGGEKSRTAIHHEDRKGRGFREILSRPPDERPGGGSRRAYLTFGEDAQSFRGARASCRTVFISFASPAAWMPESAGRKARAPRSTLIPSRRFLRGS